MPECASRAAARNEPAHLARGVQPIGLIIVVSGVETFTKPSLATTYKGSQDLVLRATASDRCMTTKPAPGAITRYAILLLGSWLLYILHRQASGFDASWRRVGE